MFLYFSFFSINKKIQIKEDQVNIFGLEENYCENSENVTLIGNPEGGIFDGPGIYGNEFRPNSLTAGTYEISYIFGELSYSKIVTINTVTELNFENLELENFFCQNDTNNIVLKANVQGGIFSGDGVQDSIFSPFLLEAGTQTIHYQYYNEYNCLSTIEKEIEIKEKPNLSFSNLENRYCKNSEDIVLSANPENGTFYVENIIKNNFEISNLEIGSYAISYFYKDENNCTDSISKNVIINPIPELNFNSLEAEYCYNSQDIILNAEPEGGIFENEAVDGNIFNPSLLSSSGETNIVYNFTDENNCQNTISQTINILDLPEINFSGLDENYCNNDNSGNILNGEPAGGVFSGSGIIGNKFYPKNLSEGTYEITYNFSDENLCYNSVKKIVNIFGAGEISIENLENEYCINSENVNLEVNINGGIFSGDGITGSIFSPNDAGVGAKTINYSVEDANNCQLNHSKNIVIYDLPEVTMQSLTENYCVNSDDVAIIVFPENGEFSGDIEILNNTFSPSNIVAGNYEISYSYTNEKSCSNTITQNISINNLPILDFEGLESSYCGNENPVNLTPNIEGGIFSGVGVNSANATFNPNNLIPNEYEIYYTFTDENSCTNIDTQKVEILGLYDLEILNLYDSYCSDALPILLETNLNGGTFTGNGMVGNQFRPSDAEYGIFEISYQFSDANLCVSEVKKMVTVYSAPEVDFENLESDYCENSNVVNLVGIPENGSFEGNGIDEKAFNPEIAGEGIHSISYSYTDENGCYASKIKTAIVHPIEDIDFNGIEEEYCLNTEDAILTSETENGTFYGDGISGNLFKPNLAGVGNHTVTYSVTDEYLCTHSKTKNLVVYDLPNANFINFDQTYCLTSPEVILLPGNENGIFSGDGIIENEFKFSPELAGLGEHQITYTVTDENNCTNTETKKTDILEVPELEILGLEDNYCIGITEIELSANLEGGTFSGDGIVGNYFYPNNLEVGTYEVFYNFNNYCDNTISKTVNIRGLPELNFDGLDENYCHNADFVNLSSEQENGIFSGNGIIENKFFPQNAEIGENEITYTYTDEFNCENSISKSVNIYEIAELDFDGLDENYCINSVFAILTPNIEGGSFSENIENNEFNSQNLGVGTHQITYSFTDLNNCFLSKTKNVSVNDIPEINILNLDDEYCENSFSVNLESSPANCNFSGNGVIDNVFTPSLASYGINTIIATFTDEKNCSNSISKDVSIFDMEDLTIENLENDYCEDAENVTLSANIDGGTFSGAGINENIFSINNSGIGEHTIYYNYTDLNNCTQIISQNVNVHQNPVVDFGYTTNIFTDTPENIVLNAGAGFSSYEWQDGSNAQAFNVQTWGDYSVEVTDENSCKSIAEVSISFSTNDLGIKKIISPVSKCELSDNENIILEIENCGETILAGETITINYNIGSTPFVEVITLEEDFLAYTSLIHTFSQTADFSNFESYDFAFSLAGGDGNFTNDTKNAVIKNLNFVDLALDFENLEDNYCINSENSLLTTNVEGGIFSGNGINENYFSPELAGEGIHEIKYTYINENNCVSEITKNVEVFDVPNFDFEINDSYCMGSNPVFLNASVEGGNFSGNGINGINFNPNVAGVGSHNISYNYTDGNSCNYEITKSVNIYEPLIANINGLNDVYCKNGESSILIGFPESGSFSGTGISGSVFNPNFANDGENTIYYNATDFNGCAVNTTKNVFINSLEDLDFDLEENYCINSENILLTPNLENGIFSGEGIFENNFFNPSVSGIGNNAITYTYKDENNCVSQITKETNILSVGEVDFDGLENEYCVNSEDLILLPTIENGIFSGEGIDGNTFSPENAGEGAKNITYSVTTENNCLISVTKNVIIHGLPSLEFKNLEDFYCVSEQGFIMNTNYTGGIFSGNDGIAGNGFFPQIAGSGTHTINYNFTDENSCENTISKEVEIIELPDASFTELEEEYCLNTPDIDLEASNEGGIFSGDGIIENKFYPEFAGLGTHILEYSYTDENNCKNDLSQNVTIRNIPNVKFRMLDNSFCKSDEAIELEATPTGGTFSGNGVNGEFFDPNDAGVGTHNIEYNYVNNFNCSNTAIKSFTINDVPSLDFQGLENEYCHNSDIVNLTPNLTGGIFSGIGIYENTFNPSSLETGVYNISYSLNTENNCYSSVEKSVTILPIIDVDFTNLDTDFCINETNMTLSANDENATFSGTAVNKNIFNPSVAGIGTNTINLHFTDENNCNIVKSEIVNIHSLPNVDFQNLENEYCLSSDTVHLQGNFENGNFYFDNSALGDTFFRIDNYNVGNHQIKFSYLDEFNCFSYKTKDFVIANLPQIEFVNLEEEYCKNSEEVILQSNFPESIFSGEGVVDGVFYPNLLDENVETTIIYCSYTDEKSCVNSIEKEITINYPTEISFENLENSYCLNDEIVVLNSEFENSYFSGNGVIGNTFNPELAAAGEHNIYLHFVNDNNCFSDISQSVNVLELPNLSFENLENSYCKNDEKIALEANFENAIFEIQAEEKDTLDIPNLEVGSYNIICNYTDENSCSNSISKNVIINNFPDANFQGLDTAYCQNSLFSVLQANENGGEFNGDGLIENIFYPNLLDSGNYEISYNITNENNCSNSFTKLVKIHHLEEIIFLNLEENYCKNDIVVLKAAPSDGFFEGFGIESDSIFKAISSGEQIIFYNYTDTNNCFQKVSRITNIRNLPIIEFDELEKNYCKNDILIALNGNQLSGIFSGDGIIGNNLNPSLADAGENQITYSYTDNNNCTSEISQSFNINLLPDLSFENLENHYCKKDEIINIQTSPTYENTNFSGGNTDKDDELSLNEIGTFIINASYTDENLCENSISQNIEIHDLPTVSINLDSLDYCKGNSLHQLSVSPEGGTFEGMEVIDNSFSIDKLESGNYKIVYEFTDGFSCTAKDSVNFEIHSLPSVSFSGIDEEYCLNNDTVHLTGTPENGIFSNYTDTSFFVPSISGDFEIKYEFVDEFFCKNSQTKNFTVHNLPDISFEGLAENYCKNSEFDILTASISSATFSENIENENEFHPENADIGENTIFLTYTDQNLCTALDSQKTIVYEIPEITFEIENNVFCINDAQIFLDVNPLGGTFEGNALTNNSFFPSEAGAGTQEIIYTYTDENFCTNFVTQEIIVNPLTDLSFINLEERYCEDFGDIELQAYPSGGKFYKNNSFEDEIENFVYEYPGDYIITYKHTDENSCKNSISKNIRIMPLPNVDILNLDSIFCVNSNDIEILPFPFTAKLFYNNEEINENIFSPEDFGVGSFEIICKYEDINNCKNSKTKIIKVKDIPDVEFLLDSDTLLCQNSDSILLKAIPKGGTFSGLGVEKDSCFFPEIANIGTHKIKYVFTDTTASDKKCSNFAEINLKVNSLPNLEFEKSIIETDLPLNLYNTLNIENTDTDTSFFNFIWNDGIIDLLNYEIKNYGNYSLKLENRDTKCSIFENISIERSSNYGRLVINAYPNPSYSRDKLMISVDQLEEKDVVIELLTFIGQVLYHKEIKDVLFFVDEFDISNLEEGIYFIRVNYGVQENTIKKVVIMK